MGTLGRPRQIVALAVIGFCSAGLEFGAARALLSVHDRASCVSDQELEVALLTFRPAPIEALPTMLSGK
jgi:hypothetical protein